MDPHIFADPDLGSQNLADPSDPNPKHCKKQWCPMPIEAVSCIMVHCAFMAFQGSVSGGPTLGSLVDSIFMLFLISIVVCNFSNIS